MKKIALVCTVLIACIPVVVSAQSSDDVIAALYAALGGNTSHTATTSAIAPPPVAPAQPTIPVPPDPTNQVLNVFQLFSVDSNSSETDAKVAGLKALLASLVSQFATLASRVAPGMPSASTTVATTTPPTSPPAPKKVFLRDLTIGATGEDVKQLQQLLISRGFLYGEVTGYFGILTKTAVLAFQADQGLPSVGSIGPRTRALLNSISPEDFTAVMNVVQSFAPPAVPFTASSTSITVHASSTSGTTTVETSSSTPIIAPPVTVSVSVLPQEAPIGGSVAVTWLSQNADSCTASDGWDGAKPTIGAARIEPLQFSLNLVLTCTGAGGVASTSALVLVGG